MKLIKHFETQLKTEMNIKCVHILKKQIQNISNNVV